jgi:hypothetical protein
MRAPERDGFVPTASYAPVLSSLPRPTESKGPPTPVHPWSSAALSCAARLPFSLEYALAGRWPDGGAKQMICWFDLNFARFS